MASNVGFSGWVPFSNPDGRHNEVWAQFLLGLYTSLGSGGGTTAVLDQISAVFGSLLFRGSGAWKGLPPGAAYQVLRINPSSGLRAWAILSYNSFDPT